MLTRRSLLRSLAAAALAGYLRVVPAFAMPVSALDRFGVHGSNVIGYGEIDDAVTICAQMQAAIRSFAKFRDVEIAEVLS